MLTLKASVRAMSPPVLISFSRMSSRRSLGLSAMYSAIATAPIIHTNTPVIYTFTHAYHKPSSTIPHQNTFIVYMTVTSQDLTFTGEFGGGQTQSEDGPVCYESVFKSVHSFVAHCVMTKVQCFQTLSERLQQQRANEMDQ